MVRFGSGLIPMGYVHYHFSLACDRLLVHLWTTVVGIQNCCLYRGTFHFCRYFPRQNNNEDSDDFVVKEPRHSESDFAPKLLPL